MKKASFVRLAAILSVVALAVFNGRPGVALLPERVAQAQGAVESPIAAAQRLTQAAGGNVAVQWSNATKVARFVRATNDATIPLSSSAATLPDKAYAFFDEYGALFGVVAPRGELQVTKVTSDETGSDIRMAQRYHGLPVFNAELIVHFDAAGAITAVNGTFLPGLKVPTPPQVDANGAVTRALGLVGSLVKVDLGLLKATQPELGVTMSGLAQDVPGTQALAWKLTVTGPDIRQFVYLDAINGGAVEVFTGIYHDRRRENYNNLSQPDYSKAVKCRFEGDAPSNEPDCDNAYTYSGDTYNLFKNGFGRDSFDGQGSPLISYVHYFSDICPNAFWNGQFMTYCSSFPHDDVTGHEITHGVTEFSANLVYAYQPGALNESFSDIFGEAIDLMNNAENELGSRWVIGEGIAPAVGLRDMEDPESLPWNNPASCGSRFYYCDTGDSGGVHTNSGVPNKAFQLMVDGGSFNGVTVKGIGLNKALAVQYRTLSRYLSVYSNFVDDYEALLASCRDLTNKRIFDADPDTGGQQLRERISKADCAQVQNALNAVEMTKAVCSDAAPTAAGPLCGSGETVASLYKEDHETGSPGWTASNDAALYAAQNWTVVSDFASSGTHAWRVNDELSSCSAGDYTSDVYLVSPNVSLTGTTRPVLRFVHDFFTESGYDGGTVEININGAWTKLNASAFTLNGYNGTISGAPNSTTLDSDAFTGYRNPASFPNLTYSESRVDLSSFVGQDSDGVVQFRFRFGTDYCNGTDVGWYLDDVEIYECKLP